MKHYYCGKIQDLHAVDIQLCGIIVSFHSIPNVDSILLEIVYQYEGKGGGERIIQRCLISVISHIISEKCCEKNDGGRWSINKHNIFSLSSYYKNVYTQNVSRIVESHHLLRGRLWRTQWYEQSINESNARIEITVYKSDVDLQLWGREIS